MSWNGAITCTVCYLNSSSIYRIRHLKSWWRGGGYKYRERLKLSEVEINKYLAKSESNLKNMVVSLLTAEEMLQERGYWDKEPRWQEYQERREEALKVVKG